MSLSYGSVLFVLKPYSELQGIRLNEQFLYYCEKWVRLLQKIKETLKMNIADSLPALLEQQKTYEVGRLCPRTPPWGGRQGKMDLNKIQVLLSADHVSNSYTLHDFQCVVLLLYFINDRLDFLQ